MQLKDKVAVVTGGAQGIGLGLCTRFAQEGAHVVLSDLKQEACEREAGKRRHPALGRDFSGRGSTRGASSWGRSCRSIES